MQIGMRLVVFRTCVVSVFQKKLAQALIKHKSDPEVSKIIGFKHVEKQIEELLQEGVEGLHLYALNSLETVDRLGPKLKEASGT